MRVEAQPGKACYLASAPARALPLELSASARAPAMGIPGDPSSSTRATAPAIPWEPSASTRAPAVPIPRDLSAETPPVTIPVERATLEVLRPRPSPELEGLWRSRRNHRVGGALLGATSGILLGFSAQPGLPVALMASAGAIASGSLMYALTASLFRRPAAGLTLVGLTLAGMGGLMVAFGHPLRPSLALICAVTGGVGGYLMGRPLAHAVSDPSGALRRQEQSYFEQLSRYSSGEDLQGGGMQETPTRVTVGGVRLPKREAVQDRGREGVEQAWDGGFGSIAGFSTRARNDPVMAVPP